MISRLKDNGKLSWVSWGLDTFVKSPITWGWKYMKSNAERKDSSMLVMEVLKVIKYIIKFKLLIYQLSGDP